MLSMRNDSDYILELEKRCDELKKELDTVKAEKEQAERLFMMLWLNPDGGGISSAAFLQSTLIKENIQLRHKNIDLTQKCEGWEAIHKKQAFLIMSDPDKAEIERLKRENELLKIQLYGYK